VEKTGEKSAMKTMTIVCLFVSMVFNIVASVHMVVGFTTTYAINAITMVVVSSNLN
jgi:hypothetical protein